MWCCRRRPEKVNDFFFIIFTAGILKLLEVYFKPCLYSIPTLKH